MMAHAHMAVSGAAASRYDSMTKEITLGIAIGLWVFYVTFARDFAKALKPYVFRLYVLLSVVRKDDEGEDGGRRSGGGSGGGGGEVMVTRREVDVGWKLSNVVRNLMVAYCVVFVVMLARAREAVQRIVIPEPVTPLG